MSEKPRAVIRPVGSPPPVTVEFRQTVDQFNDALRETVDHPAHYGGAENVYEAIKVIEAWELGFCLGNAVKYISRAGKKGDRLEDLRKAAWYVQREIERLEAESA